MEPIYRALIMKGLAKEFPRKCSCGQAYADESDYLKRTTGNCPGGNTMDCPQADSLLFSFRNCRCGSTISLELADKLSPEDLKGFRQEIEAEAVRTQVTPQKALSQFNEEYNDWRLSHG